MSCAPENFGDWCSICLQTTCAGMTNAEKHNYVLQQLHSSMPNQTIPHLQSLTFQELYQFCSAGESLVQIAHFLIMRGDRSLCVDSSDCGKVGFSCVPDGVAER